jgi:hypothetical protein
MIFTQKQTEFLHKSLRNQNHLYIIWDKQTRRENQHYEFLLPIEMY